MGYNLKIKQIVLLLCTILGFTIGAYAQNREDSTMVRKFLISYPVNDTDLHENYLDNSAALRIIKEYFAKSPRIDSIVIYSYASPEGPYKTNRRLAKERGERARQYLLEHLPAERNFPDSLIVVNYTAENWDGLYEMVSSRYPYSDKKEVLNLIGRKDISNDRRKELLRKLNGGRPWGYIKAKILPMLRYATWVAEWIHVPGIEESTPSLPVIGRQMPAYLEPLQSGAIIVPENSNDIGVDSKTILALKTNLLYDALSLLNFSIEVPLYKDKLSLLYYHQFPWWTWGQSSNEYSARFLSIGAEARWWFKPKDRLQGHFLGAYAESGKYDLGYRNKFCYQGEFYSTGLTYGYAMPIGKLFNLEFSLSAGYASIAYRGYIPSDDYEILWRDPKKVGRLHYFGPTKAQVSLVLPIKVRTGKGGGL